MAIESIRSFGPTLKTFYYHRVLPENMDDLKGLVLILHGIEGHGKRYDYVGEVLAENGYAMFAIDHIGHGMTALDDKQLGDWFPKDFEKNALNCYYLAMEMKRLYPNKPLYIIGNDFGAYFLQYMLNKFTETLVPDGAIMIGCGLNNPRQYYLYFRALLHKKIFHDRFQSNSLFKKRIAFLNKPFHPNRTTYDWLTSDEEEVDKFIIDPKSGFVGTIGYYHEYYSNVIKIPEFLKFRYTPRSIPLLFLGGDKDTVTRFSKDIKRIYHFYKKKGFEDVSLNIYPGARHDLLFEVNKDEIIDDIIRWMDIKSGYTVDFYKESPYVVESNDNKNKKTAIIDKSFEIKGDNKVVELEVKTTDNPYLINDDLNK